MRRHGIAGARARSTDPYQIYQTEGLALLAAMLAGAHLEELTPDVARLSLTMPAKLFEMLENWGGTIADLEPEEDRSDCEPIGGGRAWS